MRLLKKLVKILGMLRHVRFIMISDATMRLKEVKHFAPKVLVTGILIALGTIGTIVFFNHFANDVFGLSSDKVSLLTAENRALKDQVQHLTTEMGEVQETIENLAERGNELRLLVDLKVIDDETRQAAIGGSSQVPTQKYLGKDAIAILQESKELMGRISREVNLQKVSYDEIRKRYDYNAGLFQHLPAVKPAKGFYSINGFGMRVHPVLRVYRMHEGLDIIADVGTDVYATGDGVVRFGGKTLGGYGNVVDISHGFGYSSLYAHLSKVLVRPGQRVRRGELIAKSGRSGLVSGPHLHYEVRLNGRKQNPVDFFFDDVDAARYRTQLAQGK
ncbi:MAG TPA: M23 family metallopeptidase [Bacteroidota bacterium]